MADYSKLYFGVGIVSGAIGLVLIGVAVARSGTERPAPKRPPRTPPPPVAVPTVDVPVASAPATPEKKPGTGQKVNRAAQALYEAERYEGLHPKDVKGALERFQNVVKKHGGTPQAGVASVSVARLQSQLKRSSSGAVAPAGTHKGLVGYWKLDEGGGAVVRDSSGKKHDGKLMGEPRWVKGKFGSALRFSAAGKDDYVEIANAPALENVQESSYTLSAWVMVDQVPPGKKQGDNNSVYGILAKHGWHCGLSYNNAGQFRHEQWFEPKTILAVRSKSASAARVFHHVAVTVSFKSRKMKLFVDGKHVSTTKIPGKLKSREYDKTPWRIGVMGPNLKTWGFPMQGVIDEVRIYSRSLSKSDVAQLAGVPAE